VKRWRQHRLPALRHMQRYMERQGEEVEEGEGMEDRKENIVGE